VSVDWIWVSGATKERARCSYGSALGTASGRISDAAAAPAPTGTAHEFRPWTERFAAASPLAIFATHRYRKPRSSKSSSFRGVAFDPVANRRVEEGISRVDGHFHER